MRKVHDFDYKVGDAVIVYPPHTGWGIHGVIVEQVSPFMYPKGEFTPSNLIYFPDSRKWGTTTRKMSYVVRVNSKDGGLDLFLWATKECVSGGKHERT